jgi:hypothetical protein
MAGDVYLDAGALRRVAAFADGGGEMTKLDRRAMVPGRGLHDPAHARPTPRIARSERTAALLNVAPPGRAARIVPRKIGAREMPRRDPLFREGAG